MSSEQPYKRVPVKEARPCYPERTRRDLQVVFRRLVEDPQFRQIQTFRGQVLFAKVFVEDEGQLAKEVPNTELAKFFGVPHDQSIRAILVSGEIGSQYMGRRSALSDDDFKTINGWIVEAAAQSNPLTLDDIAVKVFRWKRIKVTKEALRKAFKRRKKVKFIDATPVQACRLNIDDVKVQRFIRDTEELIHAVPASFIFNMDETGINEYANAKTKQVVVDENFPGDQTHYPVERNTNSSTLVACIAADGSAIPPLLVVKHRTIRQILLRKCWTEEKVRFAHSDSGFITRDIFMRWLNDTFIPNVDERRRLFGDPEQTAYLLLDNCSSHKSQDIVDLCEENNIQIVYFVANTTHIFQPLDLCFFAAFKKIIRSFVPEGVEDEQSKRLLKILQSWDDAKKVATIQASFEMAGFVYDLIDNRVVVSFSGEAVRSAEAHREHPIPPPSGHRLRI